jgi:hypothetical protein
MSDAGVIQCAAGRSGRNRAEPVIGQALACSRDGARGCMHRVGRGARVIAAAEIERFTSSAPVEPVFDDDTCAGAGVVGPPLTGAGATESRAVLSVTG